MPEEEDNLFPDDMEDDEEFVEETIEYKIAPYFDLKSGEFLLNGSGQMTDADEINTFAQWCESVIVTDRYNHDALSDDIGIDYDLIFGASSREEAELIIESEVTESLLCDPYKRISFVQNVECEWTGPDEVIVEVDVVAFDNEIITINTTLSR